MLDSAEIKIVRTRVKTSLEEFFHWVISFYDQTTPSTHDVELSATSPLEPKGH